MALTSIFANIPRQELSEKVTVERTFEMDESKKKIGLFLNDYRDEFGNPFIFPVVQKCMKTISGRDLSEVKKLLSFCDMDQYSQLCCEFLFGPSSQVTRDKRCMAIPTVASQGAFTTGAEFLHRQGYKSFVVENPDILSDYKSIFRGAGFKEEYRLRLPDISSRIGRYRDMITDLEAAPSDSVVIFKMCGLDTTGIDPSTKEWEAILDIIKRKSMFPFFDAVYHGMISGDPDIDAWPVRYFAERNIDFFVAQSFSMNMGMGLERPSNLILVQKAPLVSDNLRLYLTAITRNSIFNPPAFGPLIVRNILGDADLFKLFLENLRGIVAKNQRMRQTVLSVLKGVKAITEEQRGLFLDLELSPKQVNLLSTEHHIYLPASGRICLVGLNDGNIDYFCRCVTLLILAKDESKLRSDYDSKISIEANSAKNLVKKKKKKFYGKKKE